eukprot:Selendium_serpulae@DN10690_c0_g1_i1.p1
MKKDVIDVLQQNGLRLAELVQVERLEDADHPAFDSEAPAYRLVARRAMPAGLLLPAPVSGLLMDSTAEKEGADPKSHTFPLTYQWATRLLRPIMPAAESTGASRRTSPTEMGVSIYECDDDDDDEDEEEEVGDAAGEQ